MTTKQISLLGKKRRKYSLEHAFKDNHNGTFNFNYDQSLGDWIIDTDPGIDDAFAISLAINVLGDHLKLISIQSGNVGVEQCVKNAKKLCVLNDKKYDISQGGSYTLSTMSLKCFPSIHGHDGFYDLEKYKDFHLKYDDSASFTDKERFESKKYLKQHSAVEIVRLSQQYNEENKLNIIAIGPLTNIALALMIDPSLVKRVNKVVIMGGSYTSSGNIKSVGEFNFACDSVSAKVVFDKFKNIVVYGWEPALSHLIFPEDMLFKKDNEKIRFFKAVVEKKVSSGNQAGVFCDYGAAVAAFFPLSIQNSRFLYADIGIDTEPIKDARFLLSEKNIFGNKKKNKVQIIDDVDLDVVHGLFNRMINN